MALVACNECGKEVSTTAAACPNCGAPPSRSSEVPTGTSAATNQKKRVSAQAVGVSVVLGTLALIDYFVKDTTPKHYPPEVTVDTYKGTAFDPAKSFVPYADRLKSGMDAIRAWQSNSKTIVAESELRRVDALIRGIPPTAPEYAEAQKAFALLATFQEAAAAAQTKAHADATAMVERLAKPMRANKRKALAQSLQHEYLTRNMEVTFTTEGVDATVLRFKYALVSPAFIAQLQTDGAFRQRCSDAGFKEIILEDGYGKSWTFTL